MPSTCNAKQSPKKINKSKYRTQQQKSFSSQFVQTFTQNKFPNNLNSFIEHQKKTIENTSRRINIEDESIQQAKWVKRTGSQRVQQKYYLFRII